MKSLNKKIIIIDNSKLSYDGNDLDGIKVRGTETSLILLAEQFVRMNFNVDFCNSITNLSEVNGVSYFNKNHIDKNILNDSGIIHLKTDSEFLHGYTLGKLEEMSINPIVSNHDIYKNSNAPVEATQIQTHYEKIYLNEGKKITYLNFKFNE